MPNALEPSGIRSAIEKALTRMSGPEPRSALVPIGTSRPGAKPPSSKPVPPAPPDANIDDNIKAAAAASFGGKGTPWFYNQVHNNGPWDYKQLGRQFQDFGNFNYGATGSAFGYSEDTLLRAAGWAQKRAGTSKPEWGDAPSALQAYVGAGGEPPYGDDPDDQAMIKQGIEYYKQMMRRD